MSRFSKSVMTSLNEMPFRRHDELRRLEVRRLAHVIRNQLDADPRPWVSTTARSITFSSSRTLPGQS